jgi:hypothetical protein
MRVTCLAQLCTSSQLGGDIVVIFIQHTDSDKARFKPPGCRLVMAPLGKSRDALCVKSFWRLKQVYRSLASGAECVEKGPLRPVFREI